MLVTEKAGRLRIVEKGKLLPEAVAGVPPVWSQGQGGLLDVAVHPDFAKSGWIYLSFSDPGENGSAMTKVIRGRLREGRLVDQETLFEAPKALYRQGQVHFGSRFVFDGKGHLFFSIGERGQKDDAQDLRARTARCTASTTTAASPRTTRSRSRQGRCRRSGATATATRRASRSTP